MPSLAYLYMTWIPQWNFYSNYIPVAVLFDSIIYFLLFCLSSLNLYQYLHFITYYFLTFLMSSLVLWSSLRQFFESFFFLINVPSSLFQWQYLLIYYYFFEWNVLSCSLHVFFFLNWIFESNNVVSRFSPFPRVCWFYCYYYYYFGFDCGNQALF